MEQHEREARLSEPEAQMNEEQEYRAAFDALTRISEGQAEIIRAQRAEIERLNGMIEYLTVGGMMSKNDGWKRQRAEWYTSKLGGIIRLYDYKQGFWKGWGWWYAPSSASGLSMVKKLGPYRLLSEAKQAALDLSNKAKSE